MATLSPPPILSPIALLAATGTLTLSPVWISWFTQAIAVINANGSGSGTGGVSNARAFYFGA